MTIYTLYMHTIYSVYTQHSSDMQVSSFARLLERLENVLVSASSKDKADITFHTLSSYPHLQSS